ncbi:hypothetical protein NIES39_L00260 [Arthrospira platensis NIES-39]|nr:hypothetical protein NIES39_L00260 [Arthrospira platensis NIES-39]
MVALDNRTPPLSQGGVAFWFYLCYPGKGGAGLLISGWGRKIDSRREGGFINIVVGMEN